MVKLDSRLILSNSYPYGAAGAASIMATSGTSDEGGKWCFVGVLYFVSILLTVLVNHIWAWPLFFWITSITFTIDFGWAYYKSKLKKYDCGDCGYSKCAERGKSRPLEYCTKWSPKPIQHFRLFLWTILFIITMLIFLFSNNPGARVFTFIFWVPGLSTTGVLWIDRLRFSSTPQAYPSMPNHSTSCRCRGTGSCPSCSISWNYPKTYSWSRPSWNYPKTNYSTSGFGGVCSTCKGTCLCPVELEQVAPELLQTKQDLICYIFVFILIGYVIGGMFLHYVYVYGGFV